MAMESQVALKLDGPFPSNDLLTKDGDSDIASATSNIIDQQPVKKQTRQWAAWTRQEEESFFNALRQVGKNFEKITCRVQSKNKDQVRHYYYRLVRRMNKLLGPGFSLDAKNSKDTNAAMLRWWSLLEKYSCKASKLHLKPRRFKIFIEALEHQLLKDRKKNIRKRPSHAENCSSASSTNLSLHNKASGHDSRSLKVVVVDSQSIQKVGPVKGSSLKRNLSTGCRGSGKTDLSTVKVVKQRRKSGGASSAAYKRWERAAMAGVSLVADAAEHLERATTVNGKVSPAEGISNKFCSREFAGTNGQEGMDCYNQCTSPGHQVMESSLQPSMKLKLQLFPIDETTRKTLEKDEHNPHLELTLSGRKKISSVLEHLNRKWGNSSIASGELILFPYSVQRDNLANQQRWRQDTAASAADVYASIGSPHVFRLRYGWFSNVELVSVSSQPLSTSLHLQKESVSLKNWNRREENVDTAQIPSQPTGHVDQLAASSEDQLTSVTDNTDLTTYTALPEDVTEYIKGDSENDLPETLENVTDTSWARNGNGGIIIKKHWEDVDNPRTSGGVHLSAGDWADSLTNMSVGELLSEAARANDGIEAPFVGSSQFLQQIPFSCDSFDAAIAAHISAHQEKMDLPSEIQPASSIWDAEETCDAFSFQKITASIPGTRGPSVGSASGTCKPISSSMGFRGIEELPEKQTKDADPAREEQPIDDYEYASKTDESTKDIGGLTDLYWPDSLGPLELDLPSTRYHGQDFMLSDSISLSGLNRLIANSLDAFQNCLFFGLDKKEPSSSEAYVAGPLVDHKIGGEV